MINCIIVEDEPLAQQILSQYVSDHPDLSLIQICDDPIAAITVLQRENIDLILLDINLPKLSGINFYKSLTSKPLVVFTTAYSDYAVEGFELEAVDYLLKPFSFDRFLTAISRVKDRLTVSKSDSSVDNVLMVKVDKKLFRIPHSDITYIESLRDFVRIHTDNGPFISSETLRNLLKVLPQIFVRIHKSYIINFSKVEFLEGNQLSIANKKLPIGQAYRAEIQSRFKR